MATSVKSGVIPTDQLRSTVAQNKSTWEKAVNEVIRIVKEQHQPNSTLYNTRPYYEHLPKPAIVGSVTSTPSPRTSQDVVNADGRPSAFDSLVGRVRPISSKSRYVRWPQAFDETTGQPEIDIDETDQVYALPGVKWERIEPSDRSILRRGRQRLTASEERAENADLAKLGLTSTGGKKTESKESKSIDSSQHKHGGVDPMDDDKNGNDSQADIVYRVPDNRLPNVPVNLKGWVPPSGFHPNAGPFIPESVIADYRRQLTEDYLQDLDPEQQQDVNSQNLSFHISATLPAITIPKNQEHLFQRHLPKENGDSKRTNDSKTGTYTEPEFWPKTETGYTDNRPTQRFPLDIQYTQNANEPMSGGMTSKKAMKGGNRQPKKIVFESKKGFVTLTKENLKKVLKRLKHPNEIVISNMGNKPIRVRIDYPLDKPVIVRFPCPSRGCTRAYLLQKLVNAYEKIYDEEEQSAPEKVQSIAEATHGRSKLVNRVQTSGKYGIWGHDLTDLVLNDMTLEKGVWHLSIDS